MAEVLSRLLDGIVTVPAHLDRHIRGVTTDSRQVQRDWLFLAYPGERADGRRFVTEAVARDAAAIVYEGAGEPVVELAVPALAVTDLRRHIARIADRFYGSPSRQCTVIGVTGTNGKTTCTHLIASALDRPDRRCGLVGTLGSGLPGALRETGHTTPDAVSVQRLLAELVAAGATCICMEVSSHGLEQGRAEAVAFDLALFTNLSREHLDYHGDMAAYGAAKRRLFSAPGLRYAVINIEDPFGVQLYETVHTRLQTLRFGLSSGDVYATAITPRAAGLSLEVHTPAGAVSMESPLMGRFNAANLLAALAVLVQLGVDRHTAAERLAGVEAVAGRMERFRAGAHGPTVIVDYAHTPDALTQALLALREHTRGRLYCVFGCGGDRDRGKRPLMGRVAEDLADVVVLTDDNPRHESPPAIVAGIRAGMRTAPTVIHDRTAAIGWALDQAEAEDTILVAGKGHEATQQVGDEYLPLSDRQTVSELTGMAA